MADITLTRFRDLPAIVYGDLNRFKINFANMSGLIKVNSNGYANEVFIFNEKYNISTLDRWWFETDDLGYPKTFLLYHGTLGTNKVFCSVFYSEGSKNSDNLMEHTPHYCFSVCDSTARRTPVKTK